MARSYMTRAERIKRKEDMTNLRNQGWTLQKIGDKYGITREYVRQILNGTYNTGRSRKGFLERIKYPAIRSWAEENGIESARELAEKIGVSYTTVYTSLSAGKDPCRRTIDEILSATGLTYDRAFEIPDGGQS